MTKKIKSKIFMQVFLILTALLYSSCSFFKSPSGEVKVVAIYTENSTSSPVTCYCTVELEIKNTSDRNIYSSTASISLASNKNRYYQSLGYDVTIPPGGKIFVSTNFSFVKQGDEKEWKIDSIKIEDVFFK